MKFWLTSVIFVLICGSTTIASAQSNAPNKAEKGLEQEPAQAPAKKSSGDGLLDGLDSLFSDPQKSLGGTISNSATSSKLTNKTATNNAAFDTSYKSANNVLLADKLSKETTQNPQEAKALSDFINETWAHYQLTVLQRGLKFNDLASAMSYAVSLNYSVYNNTGPNSAAQQRALYEQMKQVLAGNKGIARLADADKQLYTETLVLKATIPALYRASSRRQNNDRQAMAKAQELAAKNLTQLLGADFANLRFTDNGLEK